MKKVLWWLGWIALCIFSFFIAAHFWTGFLADHFGTMQKPGAPGLWVATVFGTWMIFLVPLIVVMYHKVDKAYEDARLAREKKTQEQAQMSPKPRIIAVDESQRIVNKYVMNKLRKLPETMKRGHLVTVKLQSGERVPYVFILDGREILGIYEAEGMTFRAGDITDVEPTGEPLPDFKTQRWLRLDGAEV